MHVQSTAGRRVRGFSLIEVMIAVVVLSFGLLALAALQGRLARASADAKAQSVALTLAEEKFEGFRSFLNRNAYQQIGNATSLANETLTRQGASATFTRTTRVTRYIVDPATNGFVSSGALTATPEQREYKLVEVSVSWSNAENQAQQVKLANIISSSSPEDSALTVRASAGTAAGPKVAIFSPTGEGIIPIAIGNNQAAASSNPQPELTRSGTTTLTQFNVQTYLGQDSATPLLQRRVDNAVINCSCQLGNASTAAAPAYAPTYWDGLRYRSPREVIGKPVGTSVGNFRQSEAFEESLCTTCCRDHHEMPGALDADGKRIIKFDPWRPTTDIAGNGNHNHYPLQSEFTASPLPSPVGTGQQYHEVCRLVRVDGIFRVATDTRLENATMLRMTASSANSEPPFSPDAVRTYSEFVKKYIDYAWNGLSGVWTGSRLDANKNLAVPNLLENCAGDPGDPCRATALANDSSAVNGSAMTISTMLDVAKQSRLTIARTSTFAMAQRGLYIDYISDEARDALACIGSSEPRCAYFRNKEVLEIIPFIAINLTKLSDWSAVPAKIVSVRNDGIANSGYVRGLVTGVGAPPPDVFAEVIARSTRGNSGLVDRGSTDPDDDALVRSDSEEFISTGTAPPVFRIKIINATSNRTVFDETSLKVEIDSPIVSPAVCDRQTGGDKDTHSCSGDASASTMVITFSNFNVADCPPSYSLHQDNICRTQKGATTAPTFIEFRLCRLIPPLPAGVVQGAITRVAPGAGPVGTGSTSVTLTGSLASLKDDVLLQAEFKSSCP